MWRVARKVNIAAWDPDLLGLSKKCNRESGTGCEAKW